MRDRQERLGRSLIQHGSHSDRIYLLHLDAEDVPGIVGRLDDLARKGGYGKIFAKVPARFRELFAGVGYRTEALVPGFFGGREDGHFMARYCDPARRTVAEEGRIREILAACGERQGAAGRTAPPDYRLRRCRQEDIPAMAELFAETFPSYPFPIHDPVYLREVLGKGTDYVGAWRSGRLAALASAEQHPEERHVEMTDFATRAGHRRQGLAVCLLALMEEEMGRRGFRIAYTIARALSRGMNLAFAGREYRFGGTLANNTQIGGRIESMNVWYKDLGGSESGLDSPASANKMI